MNLVDKYLQEVSKRYPPKSIDYNKLPNADGFWSLTLKDAKMISGATYERAQDIGGLIMFLNMVAMAWERNKGKNPLREHNIQEAKKTKEASMVLQLME